MPARRRATIRDVAAATNLSPAAVSYALRGMQTTAETQARVRRAAEELGYTGNAVARALASGRTGLVGVLSGSLEDLGEQRFVEALGRSLGRHDLHMLVADARGEPERERSLATRLGGQWVDGLVVSALDPSAGLWEELGERLPVVAVGDALGGRTVGQVLFDNRSGVTMMLEHFHALGHRRLAVLTPSRPTTPDRPAELVVAEVCARLGLDATIVNSPHSVDGATEVAAALLAARPRPTGVFCLSDSIACGVYVAAADRGLAIPRDVSVAGYDDHPVGRVIRPALTTVDWNLDEVATAAADLLAAAVAGRRRPRGRARVRVAPTLVERGSIGAPRAARRRRPAAAR
ncbi:MAG TPA: LacI family DNA-binding transcriptional regulator [Solirubrobacteraceae bacterium]|nr:LacI family DNA-binding transcriptional regulator [Solirubrobacteraceae bacterium]